MNPFTAASALRSARQPIHRQVLRSTNAAFRRHSSSKPLGKPDERSLQTLEALTELAKDSSGFPNLLEQDPFLDPHNSLTFPRTKRRPFENRVIVHNERSVFDPDTYTEDQIKTMHQNAMPNGYYQEGVEGEDGEEFEGQEEDMEVYEEQEDQYGPEDMKDPDSMPLSAEEGEMEGADLDHTRKIGLLTALTGKDREGFYRFPLVSRIVKHQTGKGKVSRFSSLVVVGNGAGLVGYGEAKDAEGAAAYTKALVQAYRRLDHVERFEERTVWTEMSSKLGATQIVIRPRPVGFGLHCNPYAHQVLKAAGIKDASVKVWGSRNPGNVIKALFRMLHAGNAPLGMGNGVGGGGKKLEKGTGMRSAMDIERERGRRMLSLQKH